MLHKNFSLEILSRDSITRCLLALLFASVSLFYLVLIVRAQDKQPSSLATSYSETSPLYSKDIIIGAYPNRHEKACFIASNSDGSRIYIAYELWSGTSTLDKIRVRYSLDGGETWNTTPVEIDWPKPLSLPVITITPVGAFVVFENQDSSTDFDILAAKVPLSGDSPSVTYQVDYSTNDLKRPFIVTDAETSPTNPWLYVVAYDNTNDNLIFTRSKDQAQTWDPPKIIAISLGKPHVFQSMAYCGGKLYVTFVALESGRNVIKYTRSTSFGDSWSTPITVASGSRDSKFPVIACKGDFVIITYEQFNGSDWDIKYAYNRTGGIGEWSQRTLAIGTANTRFPHIAIEPEAGNRIHLGYVDLTSKGIEVFSSTLQNPDQWVSNQNPISDNPDVSDDDRVALTAMKGPRGNYGAGVAWVRGSQANYNIYYDASWRSVTSVKENTNELPDKYFLAQNCPNPFNPETTIEFNLSRPEKVDLLIYDVRGNLVRTLLDGTQKSPGCHRMNWNGQDDRGQPVSSGVYFYKIQTGSFTQTKKMTLLH